MRSSVARARRAAEGRRPTASRLSAAAFGAAYLRDGRRPELEPEHLWLRRVRLEQHLPASLVHLRNDLLLGQISDADVAGSADVVEQ